MSMTRAIQITSRLYELRDGVKLVLGPERYPAVVKEYASVLRGIMRGSQTNEMGALIIALNIAKSEDVGEKGVVRTCLAAAYVEMIEGAV